MLAAIPLLRQLPSHELRNLAKHLQALITLFWEGDQHYSSRIGLIQRIALVTYLLLSYFSSTTTQSLPLRPKTSGEYISSAFAGGTMKVPGVVARAV